MAISSYKDLDAWQQAMLLVEAVYGLTHSFPREEAYGLTSQLRRSVVGIPSNLSEGHQQSTRAYRHYVALALGCHAECETQLEIAQRLKLAPEEELVPVVELTARVGRLLHGLARSLRRASK